VKIKSRNQKNDCWKARFGPAGLHVFNRSTGLNVLLDEIPVSTALYSLAPRQVSIALTNQCDLTCRHCYAPKDWNELPYDDVMTWLFELDLNGTFGVGFGGGEPTLYPEFAALCQHLAGETQLSVSFTTHGHHIDERLAEGLRGNVHFIRLSMDGVGNTYESIRRRSFQDLLARMRLIQTIAKFGVNFIVNQQTLPDLDEAVAIAEDFGSCEVLLLPQMATRWCLQVGEDTLENLRRWVEAYRGRMRLSISEGNAEGFPTCDPTAKEQGVRAYAHIDASGSLRPNSYHAISVPIGSEGVLNALGRLAQKLEVNDL
jgi:MoaA/NifB/PqqE/SkfB family radical SAM enzyme